MLNLSLDQCFGESSELVSDISIQSDASDLYDSLVLSPSNVITLTPIRIPSDPAMTENGLPYGIIPITVRATVGGEPFEFALPITVRFDPSFSCGNVTLESSGTRIPFVECNALAALYTNTNGANWQSVTGFDADTWLRSIFLDEWSGVTIDGTPDSEGFAHVTELDFSRRVSRWF